MKKMMIVLAIALTGCGGGEAAKNVSVDVPDRNVANDVPWREVTVIEVDGCEYLFYWSYDSSSMIHKENCKNHTLNN